MGSTKENKLTIEDTKKIAKLARINLSNNEEIKFTVQLNNMLNHFKKISELNTDEVEPRTHPTEIVNSFRDDIVKPSLSKEDVLKNAPHKKDGYFKAPRIV